MSIGERISEMRKKQNISQVQLAKALNVSRQAVSKWENDQTSPDTINLIRLADLLGTDTEYLATGNHSAIKSSPAVVERVIEKPIEVEKIVEIEKIIEIEKPVEVQRIVERVVEVPKIKRVTRIKYRRNPLEYALLGLGCFILGLVVGLLLF